jgi:hypothetical protein
MPPSLTPSDCILCPQRILFYFVWFSEKIAIISLCIIKRLAFIIPKESVYCAVRNKHLNKIHGIFRLQKLKPIQIFLERKFSLFNQNPRTTDKTKLNYSKRRWESKKNTELSHGISSIHLRTEYQRKGTNWTRFTPRTTAYLCTNFKFKNNDVCRKYFNFMIKCIDSLDKNNFAFTINKAYAYNTWQFYYSQINYSSNPKFVKQTCMPVAFIYHRSNFY